MIDKGFCLNYWRLSYRRKFIRTLWLLPVLVGVVIFIFNSSVFPFSPIACTVLLAAMYVIQLAYTGYKWAHTQASAN